MMEVLFFAAVVLYFVSTMLQAVGAVLGKAILQHIRKFPS